jgi:hypothetical protein
MMNSTVNTTLETANNVQSTLFEVIEHCEKENQIKIRPSEFNEILFGVAELPLFVQRSDIAESLDDTPKDIDMSGTDHFEGYKALLNKSNGQHISIVSEKYHVVDNTAVLEHFEKMLDDQGILFEYGFATTARHGRKTVMEIILPELTIDLGNGDTQEMRLYIQNSFDGGNAIRLDMGFFRHLCSNMALMQGTADVQYRTSHIGDATDRIKTEFNFYITEQFNKTKNFVEKLTQLNFSSDTAIEQFINDEKNTVVSDRARSKVLDSWNTNYRNQFGNSFWGVYNAYTHIITHVLNGAETGKLAKLVSLSKKFNGLIDDIEKI